MILGFTPFTLTHVVVSLAGIVAGVIVVIGMLGRKSLDGWTALFLVTTVLTSVTGFGFPFFQFLPSHAVGIISLVVLAPAIFGRYARHLAGRWRATYVIGAVVALYLNVFVLIVQAFRRVPALSALAPTQSEPPFIIGQLLALVLFAVLGVQAVKRYKTTP